MRDPKRMDIILKLIEKLWKRYPDLRLMQLLMVVAPTQDQDPFYLEDDVLVNYLKHKLEKDKREKK